MTAMRSKERKELLIHFAGQALAGVASEPNTGVSITADALGDKVAGDIAGSVWSMALAMVAHYETDILPTLTEDRSPVIRD